MIDVSGLGYQGGIFGTSPRGAPAGVAGAVRSGGSHGGLGSLQEANGIPGPVYDSVYRPQLGGGGGDATPANRGGGVIDIEAGELELLGELRRAASTCWATSRRSGPAARCW